MRCIILIDRNQLAAKHSTLASGLLAVTKTVIACFFACMTANGQTPPAHATPILARGQVGIKFARVPDDASADRLGGFLITYVWRRSPAAVAGLKPGDIIVAVNHESVFGKPTDQIPGLAGAAGDTVSFTICRLCEGKADRLLTFEGLRRVATLPKPDRSTPKADLDEFMALAQETAFERAANNAWNPPSTEQAPVATLSDTPSPTQPSNDVSDSGPSPDKHPKLRKFLSALGAITGGTTDAEGIVGEWKQENHDRYNPKEIWLTLNASGSYEKVMSARMFGSGQIAIIENGTWTSAGTVVQLSGDKDHPPSTVDLRSFVRGR